MSLQENDNAPMVERLAVEDLPPRKARPSTSPRLHLHSIQEETPQVVVPPVAASVDRSPAVLDILKAIGLVLSARALVLVFGLCGFALALVGMMRDSSAVLFVFVAWNASTVIPAIVLEIWQVWRGRQ
jgi:hypothetical protein